MEPISKEQLIGAWQLKSCRSFTGDGRELDDMLAKSTGVIIYHESGLMSVQIMSPSMWEHKDEYKNYPIQPPFDSIPNSVARMALENYLCYYGSYVIDIDNQSVLHHIQGSNLPHYIGHTLRRHFSFIDADNLFLDTALGEKTTQVENFYRRLHWQRIFTI